MPPPPRLTIRELMIATAVVAVCAAGVRSQSFFFFWFTVGLLPPLAWTICATDRHQKAGRRINEAVILRHFFLATVLWWLTAIGVTAFVVYNFFPQLVI